MSQSLYNRALQMLGFSKPAEEIPPNVARDRVNQHLSQHYKHLEDAGTSPLSGLPKAFTSFEKALVTTLRHADRLNIDLQEDKIEAQSKICKMTKDLHRFLEEMQKLKKQSDEIFCFYNEYIDSKGISGILEEKINTRVLDTIEDLKEAQMVVDELRELCSFSMTMLNDLTTKVDSAHAIILKLEEERQELQVRFDNLTETGEVTYSLLRDNLNDVRAENEQLKTKCEDQENKMEDQRKEMEMYRELYENLLRVGQQTGSDTSEGGASKDKFEDNDIETKDSGVDLSKEQEEQEEDYKISITGENNIQKSKTGLEEMCKSRPLSTLNKLKNALRKDILEPMEIEKSSQDN